MENYKYKDLGEDFNFEEEIKDKKNITFSTSSNANLDASINIYVEDGDVIGVLEVIKENGGVWGKIKKQV